jgi:hypothetical protein
MQQTKETLKLSPQVRTVLAHLTKHKSLTQAEAGTVYRIRALPRRIADLKEAGYKIRSEHKQDATGQRYVRYFLEGYENPNAEPFVKPEAPVLREGARIRVTAAWPQEQYKNGDEGTVSIVDGDDDIWAVFPNIKDRQFLLSDEFEVIA